MEQHQNIVNALSKELKDLKNSIVNYIDDFFRSFLDERVDLDTLAHQLEERILLISNKKAKQKGITYAGGTLTICFVTESLFSCQFSLYFQNTQGKWIKESGNSPELSTTLYLTDEAAKELHEKKEIQYELELPSHKEPSPSVAPAAEAPQESKNTSTPPS